MTRGLQVFLGEFPILYHGCLPECRLTSLVSLPSPVALLRRALAVFMGTTLPYNTWIVIGVYYPPKLTQGMLI